MTNREKFREVFNKDIHWSRALEPQILALKSAYIDGIDCMEEWLNSEYIEPQVEGDNKKIMPWYLEPFKQAIETLGSNEHFEESEGKSMKFQYKPINPFQDDGLSKEDRALIKGIRNAAYECGCRGEDVEFFTYKTLKGMGRDDLLPPCEQKK